MVSPRYACQASTDYETTYFSKNPFYRILGCEQQGCSASGGCSEISIACRSADPGGGGGQSQQSCVTGSSSNSLSTCYASCCAESAKKVSYLVDNFNATTSRIV